jgi:hypothetical protein
MIHRRRREVAKRVRVGALLLASANAKATGGTMRERAVRLPLVTTA